MIGCLTLPFRLLGIAAVILVLVGGWLYRDRIVAEVRRIGTAEQPSAVGRPGADALASARDRVAGLTRGGADSVVLTPAEAASLLGAGLDPLVRNRLDSLEVRLGAGWVAASGVVETGRLPADLVGPLSIALRDHERVTVGGPLRVVEPGRAEWAIDRFELRDLPFPRDVVPHIVTRALGEGARGALAVRIPETIEAIRIEPQGVILYRDARP